MATISETDREQRLTELVKDDAFLNKLAEVARLSGWSNDYVEVRNFVEECFQNAERPVPDLDPYEIDYEENKETDINEQI